MHLRHSPERDDAVWISPRHPDRERLLARPAGDGPSPPEPSGEILATLTRRSREGPDQELRVSLEEYNGHPFLRLQLWDRGRGGWWPLKGKAISVRMDEARAVAEVLLEGID